MPNQDQPPATNEQIANPIPATPQPAVRQSNPLGSGQGESVSDGRPSTGSGLKGIALLQVGLFELLFVVGGLLIIFGLLNYYNVIPISRSFPFLSFLPQKQKIVENKTQTQTIKISEADLYKKIKNELSFSGCPLKSEICKNAEIIKPESTQSAQWVLQFKSVPDGTEILAALNGTINVDDSTITITNKGRLLKAYYEFEKGSFDSQASSSASISQGEILGRITKGSDFEFYLINTTTDDTVSVRPRPDGQSLILTEP